MSDNTRMPDRIALPMTSVIIPTYNRVGYLAEALESITHQSVAPAQVIVVDDGSTDRTHEFVASVGPPIEYHAQDHQGVAAARNLGLAVATGEIITWLDSDDLWEPDFLETTLTALTTDSRLDGVYTGITHVDAANNPVSISTRVEAPENLYDTLVESNFLATPTLVIRKRCYDAVGEFDTRLKISEDTDMWLRLARRFHITGIPRPLARIRVHAGSTMGDHQGHLSARLMLTAKHFGDLADEAGQNPPERRKAYAFTFRMAALLALESARPEEAWPYLSRAAELYPPLLERLDTYYELALADQPRGYRGVTQGLDIRSRGDDLVARLGPLLAKTPDITPELERAAWSNAYLALGMLADQAGNWSLARRYLLQAARANPALLADPSFGRRLAKLAVGKQVANLARRRSA